MFSLPTNSLKEMPTQMFLVIIFRFLVCPYCISQIMNLSYLFMSDHDFFFFYKWQCTKKLGFKNIFNEEYELYHPKKTCEYIFSKSFWFILKTDLVKCRSTMYVWDELYFFKGSYSIRITQWSRKVIARKRLFKEINMLLQERLTFKDTVWRTDKEKIVSWPSREQIFTRLSDRYAENIVRLTLFFPVRSDIFRYVC